MADRDPRIEPKPGDVFIWRRMFSCQILENDGITVTDEVIEPLRGVRTIGKHAIDKWQQLMAESEVIHMADELDYGGATDAVVREKEVAALAELVCSQRQEIKRLSGRVNDLLRANNEELDRRRAAEMESRERLVQIHALMRENLATRDLYAEPDARFHALCKRTGALGGENIYTWCADRLEELLDERARDGQTRRD